MAAWQYEVNTLVAGPDSLKVGFTVRTEHWVKFGKLEVPYTMVTAHIMRTLVMAWEREMEGPPEIDTPMSLTWSTDE
jgi:hypothetical protein